MNLSEEMAKELVRVQPMPSDIIQKLLAESTPRAELEANGYKPISRLGLLWVKDDESN